MNKLPFVDEGRKCVILPAASILAARKLAQSAGGKRVHSTIVDPSEFPRRISSAHTASAIAPMRTTLEPWSEMVTQRRRRYSIATM